jgi:hypothetical protein
MSKSETLPYGPAKAGPSRGFPVDAKCALVAFLIAVVIGGNPSLQAQETDDQQAGAGTVATEPGAGDDEATKTDDESKAKKGPSLIPIPIFITEPAIGYGLGAAVGYFHKKKDGSGSSENLAPALTTETAAQVGKRQKAPPTISGVAAAYTEKGTWGFGGAHSASWKKDTVRYLGVVGYAHVVTTVYFGDQPFDLKLDTGLLYQSVKFRIGDSRFFVGGNLVYLNPKLAFDEEPEDIPVDQFDGRLRDFGVAIHGDYDSRDYTMTPNSGQFVELMAWRHLEVLGGETDYSKIGFKALSFHEMMQKKLVLGLRLDIDSAGGHPPLWGYPWVTLRGVPALRYQNESTGVVETELRWNIFGRWAVLGFIGVGATRGDVPQYEDESGIVAGGVGGRFNFRPQDNLWVGVDVARGPEDYVLYIQVGHAW